jgi:hypothetical protein
VTIFLLLLGAVYYLLRRRKQLPKFSEHLTNMTATTTWTQNGHTPSNDRNERKYFPSQHQSINIIS